jgi:hypothetical protein
MASLEVSDRRSKPLTSASIKSWRCSLQTGTSRGKSCRSNSPAHLSAELPLLVRSLSLGIPARSSAAGLGLGRVRHISGRALVQYAAGEGNDAFTTHGQIAKVQDALPHKLCAAWRSAKEDVIPPPEGGERPDPRSDNPCSRPTERCDRRTATQGGSP